MVVAALLSVVALFGSRPAVAQRYEDIAAQHRAPQIYHEAVVLPGGAGDSAAVVVAFRIPNSRLVFLRSQAPEPARAFVAEPEVTVEVMQRGQPVAAQRWTAPHYVPTFEATQRRDETLTGSVRVPLPPGTYAYRLHLGDPATRRDRAARPRAAEVPGPDALLHAPVIARRVRQQGSAVMLDLAALGGDVPFGQPVQAVVPVRLPSGTALDAMRLRAALVRLDAPDGDVEAGTLVRQDTLPGADWLAVQPATLTVDGTTLRWQTARSAMADVALVPMDLDGPVLPDGAYALRLTLVLPDGTEAHRTARFHTHWRDMPLALYHPEVAIRALRFIEDRDTIRRLLRGGRDAQERHVRAYWQARDPTPRTAFNELMAEYYRRVDHAAATYRTAQSPVPDGLRTDAAAVYVAYGPPDHVDRTFPPHGGVRETWHYAGDRRFVFWAPTSLDPLQLQARPSR
jgi:GWxTD domain-containing protein